jgi:L-ascorbate metabolism protein UlaG (beta-lactamase superfamily)
MGPCLRLVEYATPRGAQQIERASAPSGLLGARISAVSAPVTAVPASVGSTYASNEIRTCRPGEHADHWTPEQLKGLLATNPSASVFGPAGVAAALGAEGIAVETVTDGDTVEVGPFTLTFAGTDHAVIHESIPVPDNTGVLVNGKLFYPGDAFFVPPFPVEVLAAPVGAPWLKISEAMDYVSAVKPARSFPVHEKTLSDAGFGMHADRIGAVTTAGGGTPSILQPGESLDI